MKPTATSHRLTPAQEREVIELMRASLRLIVELLKAQYQDLMTRAEEK